MRDLFILYGAPGCGKSTLTHSLNMADHTIGFDQMRAIFSPLVASSDGPSLALRGNTHKEVIRATFAALEARMSLGETLFFDSTAVKVKDQNRLISVAHKWGYAAHIVDVQGDMTWDEIQERNNSRPVADRLPLERLEVMWKQGATKMFSDQVDTVLRAPELPEFLLKRSARWVPHIPMDKDTIIVGDVHSHSQQLAQAIQDFDSPTTQWVFVGDLFDRGDDPVGVWNLVHDLGNRATIVSGNHEKNLREISTGAAPKGHFRDTRDTALILWEDGHISAKEQREFATNHVVAAVVLAAGDNPHHPLWLVTHGGVGVDVGGVVVTPRQAMQVTEFECIYGHSSREKVYAGKSHYNVADFQLAGSQFHGHRSNARGAEPVATSRVGAEFDWSLSGDGNVYCLEAGVTDGGAMRIARLVPGAQSPELRDYPTN